MELTLESVITVKHYIEALEMCMRDVSAKHSVQNYRRHAVHHIAEAIEAIEEPDERDRMMAKLRRRELKGICLGSQISQIMALAVPNPVDHLIKDKLGCESYTRHMDDGIILLNSRERLEEIRETIKKEAEKHGLILNPRKTRIVRFKDGFTFLKVRYRADGYKTIRTIAKSSAVRQRRKLKKFGPKLCAGAMTQEDVKASMTSWEASTRGTRSFRRIRAMRKKYRAVLKEYKNEIL